MAKEKNEPIMEVRVGSIKSSIWKHNSDNGPRFSTKQVRIYRLQADKRDGEKDSGWRETEFLSRDDLLIANKVNDKVFEFITEYKAPESE